MKICIVLVAAVVSFAGRLPAQTASPPPASPSAAPSLPATPPRSAADGIFSRAQIARGRSAYNSQCARCHGEALGGVEDSPALVEARFFKKWAGKTVGELVEYTREEMPSDGTSKLSRKRSTDIITYMLSANGFPAGDSELVPELEVLNRILIPAKK